MTEDITQFEQMGLQETTLKALRKMGFEAPTPIQAKTVPVMRDGHDVIAKAPTGTGKTCAFGIPILESLNAELTEIQAAIICPTRELCIQIAEELRELAGFRPDVRIAALYGGQPLQKQFIALKKNPHIIVATPGRLLDHMGRGTAWLGNVYTMVLDEADEMLKMGFIKDVRKILNSTPADTQVVMFSATISRDVEDVAWEYQHGAVSLNVEAEGENRPQIRQYMMECGGDARVDAMMKIIDALDLRRVMVFANRKVTVQWLDKRLRRAGRSVDCLHGDIPQGARNKVMSDFKAGRFEILVCTDVAARGIDIDDVEAVFNFDLPDENEYYLHRIGRTGRAKRHGMSFTFMTAGDQYRMRDIKKYCRSEIKEAKFGEDGGLVLEK